ncbi:hypothetical protein A3K48_06005 [candidate division WOR-1 bacterium RIFOXYA12_FULL_52_29]|uniref:Uncharacterized protein n=1 Tax=candidate division WOR-1 bacterium RIFOXYC12_FULL_54_18 TaxID=1802584 RepID=A0A1F4T8Z6_UNCSA|nr:MAG: hypothetical protein A3K44_06005 [candidate division WOR-1 bacterium RIFOXYA2_FULL_51_19]OGC18086.1 MAG: hypothetical protein A3K48_06005 [candidate division WOR-1 bacterium RIFOXYA12_FULL_52_29]OGC26942.1 MAG: hypothetical protein A3K32_06000 [candidate division WOR-1 bacterium RIFOXYB2_FULL_45_9]OGC28503.1 MAG: hypothetical protein A3K49_06005 [candidate division WOR-1 bacterium RIFOXYC12_FULL_54_18]OGC31042.1 MAG: hypothetical protein A2346_06615 [candidate division WOR-1 bacterium R
MLNFSSTSPNEEQDYLIKSGFKVLARKPKAMVISRVDGKDHLGKLEADYLVSRDNHQFIVVVQQGEGALDPSDPIVRRRLVEFDRAFNCHGLVFFNPHESQLQVVSFRFVREKGWLDLFFQFLMFGLAIAVVAGIIWLMIHIKMF